MENKDYSVIITIVNKGFADNVMNSARTAGATGGTIINARGTGNAEIEKFLGMEIQPEKELIMILTNNEKRHDIMMAIYKEVGLETEASGFSFSMPVSDMLGGARFEPFNNETEEVDKKH